LEDIAIKLNNVSKTFEIDQQKGIFQIIKNKINKNTKKTIGAIQDISFSIEKGEVVGIIGLNGGGKTTLLRLISGIYKPDKGSIQVNGRLSSLLQFGAGFQDEFDAKENILMNGMLLGLSKTNIEKKVENIIKFAELEEFSKKKLKWSGDKTEWGNYYSDTNYSDVAFSQKKEFVSKFLKEINPKLVWDLGANTGIFSRLSSDMGINTISFDIDPVAVEKNYLECIKKQETKLLPLLLDLTNPSPNIGWANNERMSFVDRGPADAILALALIHHLVISNNVPLSRIVEFFKKNCNNLIIEFIPKTDSQVQRLLATREDIFVDYDKENFEKEFKKDFIIRDEIKIKESERILYSMKKIQ